MSQSNRGQPQQPENKRVFFSQTNYARLLQPLRETYERKLNKPELPEDVDKRLQKTLQHYMNEVYKVNPQYPVTNLNNEAFRETSLSVDQWLQKQVSVPVRGTYQQAPSRDQMFESVGSRYEREQQNRAPAPPQASTNVDFSLPRSDEDEEDPLEKYERIRKLREAETRAVAPAPKNTIIEQTFSEPSAPSATSLIQAPQSNNPPPPPVVVPRPQDYIIKQEDVVKYKENEINLYLYSGDRDWLNNTKENRYNFTINFNPASTANTATFSPSVKERFKNIVRMELVKAIVSSESLNTSVRVVSSNPVTSRVFNVLQYPYIMIRISEWTGNGFGTSEIIDNTFGLVQYDQTWKSDSAAPNFGYISMTPRYLKAQRVYHPTPLATLQKLSIQIETPNGSALTTELDTLNIKQIYLAPSTLGSAYSSGQYLFVRTETYFSQFAVAEGDTILVRGFDVGTDSNVIQSYANDFNTFINSSTGQIVVGIGCTTSPAAPFTVSDGANAVGYANVIIFRSRFDDPTTGATSRSYFGGSSANEDIIKTRLAFNVQEGPCALLNQNRQSHLVLRLITREMDSMSNLRPDNS